VQTDDRQVRQLLLWLTLLPVDEVADVMARHAGAPQHREAQRLLAREVVTLVHGGTEARAAEDASGEEVDSLDGHAFERREETMPSTVVHRQDLPVTVADLFARTGLARSKTAASKLAVQGGAYVNNIRHTDPEQLIGIDDLEEDRWLLLRAGKRARHLVVVSG
jgi:tyrosyl-tRNA synthetase